jgi:sporulation protein YlmC with PRC-barrel domain
MNERATLVRLGDTGQTVADPAEDIRGRTITDRDGAQLGTIDELLIDTAEHKVRFLRIVHGGILGLGATPSFIPVDAITDVSADAVTIDQTSEKVAAAPAYDPELADVPAYYDNLYAHYGYMPYWGPGYMYPRFPTYRTGSSDDTPS